MSFIELKFTIYFLTIVKPTKYFKYNGIKSIQTTDLQLRMMELCVFFKLLICHSRTLHSVCGQSYIFIFLLLVHNSNYFMWHFMDSFSFFASKVKPFIYCQLFCRTERFLTPKTTIKMSTKQHMGFEGAKHNKNLG